MKVNTKAARTNQITPLERANRQVSYEAALEGIVLLENDGILPLTPGKIALYGAGAGMTIKGGTGSGEVNERHTISILEGLENAGFIVSTKKWIARYRQVYEQGEKEYAQELRRRLRNMKRTDFINIMSSPYQYPAGPPVTGEDVEKSGTDTCIYVVARQAGEAGDRKLEKNEYHLSAQEKANLAFCAARYANLIVVINVGSVFDMQFLEEIEGIRAVIYYCQQGMMGGQAFADLLCGKAAPSGKTVDTWPVKYEDIPFAGEFSYLNGNLEEEAYREGIYVGYRYFDSYEVEPRYPFGYGLSYTGFSVEAEEVSLDEPEVTVKAKVTNTGDTYPGKETVQLYVSCPPGRVPKEYQKLAAFAKTRVLMPGQSQTVELKFSLVDLASFCEEERVQMLEPGAYILRLGTSSRQTEPIAVLMMEEEKVTAVHRSICAGVEPVREIHPPQTAQEPEDPDLRHLKICGEKIQKTVYEYCTPGVYSSGSTDAVLDALSPEEWCSVVAGAGMFGGGPRFFDAPGSAGYTTGAFIKKGLPNICLADGPAGLRLQRVSTVTKCGRLKGTQPFISAVKYLPDAVKKVMLGNPDRHPCVYQFATSFPVGLALAQTWNPQLLERVGEAVGKEMEAYGITYWLAPGMNIHRNPLCGRNFEYYSEDPLLSGKMAAAITRGVQSRRGCFVTLKHFCCNNQEDNRNHVSANVNERALREIYLKGFEIAVREGKPGAVMSSYNKVNGTYVNNSYELLTMVLRNEWGFDGLVMTDWFATGEGLGSNVEAIEAGNDLIMPGGQGAVRELRKALRQGMLDETDVKRCAANVTKGILESRIYQAYRRMTRRK